jgi:hypothetical protein
MARKSMQYSQAKKLNPQLRIVVILLNYGCGLNPAIPQGCVATQAR